MNNSSQGDSTSIPQTDGVSGSKSESGTSSEVGANFTQPAPDSSSSEGITDVKIRKSSMDEEIAVCVISDLPISRIYEGVVIKPGCAVLVNADVTKNQVDPKNSRAVVVTICATRRAGAIVLGASDLSSYELLLDGRSLISTVGYSDDSQLTVFKEDNCEGQVLKRLLGTSAASNKLTQLYNLSRNRYMYDNSLIEGNIRSIKMQTSTETLSDCSNTVRSTQMDLYHESKTELHSGQLQVKSSRQKFLERKAQNN